LISTEVKSEHAIMDSCARSFSLKICTHVIVG
jgi:hypothetical protein